MSVKLIIEVGGYLLSVAKDISIPGSIAYVGASLFTKINPMTAATTVGLANLISKKITQPLFAQAYPSYARAVENAEAAPNGNREETALSSDGKTFIDTLMFAGSYFASQYLVEKLHLDTLAEQLIFGAFPNTRGFVYFIITASKISCYAVGILIVGGFLYQRYHVVVEQKISILYTYMKNKIAYIFS